MYTKEEKKRAIEYCHAHGMDVDETIARLGYPSRSSLFYWLSDAGLSKRRHILKYPFDVKMKALRMAYGQNLTLAEVAKQLGIKNPVSISIWKRRYLNGEVDAFIEKGGVPMDPGRRRPMLPDEINALKERIRELEFENDCLAATVNVLKKQEGLSFEAMTNKEKSLAITMLRPKYKLKNLLTRFDMSKSSHWYAMSQVSHPDRYSDERALIHSIFEGSGRTYGYRRIWMSLRRDAGLIISEKVVRRLMKEEGVVVKRRHRRKYSSYMGTIGIIPENVLDRDFSSALPNTRWVTDITELLVGEDRIYLSAIVDLLDGEAVSYSTSLHPNMELVMATVDDALIRLSADEHPVIHSDYAEENAKPQFSASSQIGGLAA